jgi:Ala-tRNA(Pro) deacylase
MLRCFLAEEVVMSETVFDRLQRLLSAAGADFTVLRHEPVYTSAEAAQVRGTPLASGAKALMCKLDERFAMFVLPADRKLDSRETRRRLGVRSLRFADPDEVLRITGLAPGAIPPFGSLFGLPTLLDGRMAEHERINFNAGDHAISISLAYADYVRIEKPELGTFAV